MNSKKVDAILTDEYMYVKRQSNGYLIISLSDMPDVESLGSLDYSMVDFMQERYFLELQGRINLAS